MPANGAQDQNGKSHRFDLFRSASCGHHVFLAFISCVTDYIILPGIADVCDGEMSTRLVGEAMGPSCCPPVLKVVLDSTDVAGQHAPGSLFFYVL